jgi:two-component system NtrC family sensor kinase
MRLGIRLQVLLALGVLLVLAFVPLYFAVASLTRTSLGQVRADSAVSLGRAVAGHVAVAGETRPLAEMEPLLSAQLGTGGVTAVGVYDAAGRLATRAAEEGWADGLPASVPPGAERIEAVRPRSGAAQLLVVPHTRGDSARGSPAAPPLGAVAVLVRTDTKSSYSAPLLRLVAMYTGIVGLGLLVFAYLAMTRLVVRPVVELSDAARRVREGGRRFEAKPFGAAEIVDLSRSVAEMTERLRVEEEQLREKIAEALRYAEDLTRAQERLVRSERLASVGRLAAGLAHEIGNPISAILGFQDLLLMGGLSGEEERDFLERMKRETERIHKILRDLLDFARPAAQPRAAGPDLPSSAADAVADAAALVRPQKEWKSITLETDVAPDIPLVTLAHGRLVQVLLNLLLNAGDVVPPDTGRVMVRAARAPEPGRVKIVVEDNGPGVAKEMEDRLFEPFATNKEVGKGTGLGLAVCRGLVEAAGGTITAERAESGGARFVVELPAAP